MDDYAKLAAEAQDLLSKSAADHSLMLGLTATQGDYERVRDKFGAQYGGKMLDCFEKMSKCLSDAEGDVGLLKQRLGAQKKNLFLRFSKNYRTAEGFLATAKTQLEALHKTEDEVRQVLTSDQVPYACYMFFNSREW
jgi:hypothetical protein